MNETVVPARLDLRLRNSRQIRWVLDHGLIFRGKHLLARTTTAEKISPKLFGEGPFLAVVISRKKEKSAVFRNRMKRRLKELFRKHREQIGKKNAWVLIARDSGTAAAYQEIESDFLNLVQTQSGKQKK